MKKNKHIMILYIKCDYSCIVIYSHRQRALDVASGAILPPSGVLPGSIAICRSTFGNGRLVVFSTHPEARCQQSLQNGALLCGAVLYAASRTPKVPAKLLSQPPMISPVSQEALASACHPQPKGETDPALPAPCHHGNNNFLW
jgi:hypothetical protein